MNKYIWRRNHTSLFVDQDKTIRGKLAFKTKSVHWLDTQSPVIAMISLHTAFHESNDGDLKMNAFMSTIKSHVKGKITVLICDIAHKQAMSLEYQNNLDKAFETCILHAQKLRERYQHYFESCSVVQWHSYISQDTSYGPSFKLVKELYENDFVFQELLKRDAEAAYTEERMQKFPDKDLFLQKTHEDILEQCASILVLANKGYRFQFYPGNPNASTEYVGKKMLPSGSQLSWVHVFLTIEKKTITLPAI